MTLTERPAVGVASDYALSQRELDEFRTNGYLVIRNAIDEASLKRFADAARTHPPVDQILPGQQWPGPGRYTLARNAMADPDMAFLMKRPEIVDRMASILEDDPKVIMFAYYDRTPGGKGLPSHNDYKRWRPIGSSMRWAFAIVALSDFDDAAGPLEFAPGSHRVPYSQDPYAPVVNAAPAVRPAESEFIDPHLRRGDLAIVDMHCWHRAGDNNSDGHRIGMFTKWCAASQPPATGWYPYTDAVRQGLGADGEHILGYSSDLAISTTSALIERVRSDGGTQYLFLEADGKLRLPSGPAVKEGSIPDWDEGNYIASCQDALAQQVKTRPVWMSYVGDYEETANMTRVYGYRLPAHAWGIHAKGVVWLSPAEIEARSADLAWGFEGEAVAEWQRAGMVRGKGVSEATGRADQYSV